MSDIVTRVKSRMTAQHIKPDKIKTIKTRALSEVIDDFQGQAYGDRRELQVQKKVLLMKYNYHLCSEKEKEIFV